MLKKIVKNVRDTMPLIHCITNYVTVNDCANILLALGGSPIMADDIKDAVPITEICKGLVINIGTLNERTIETMLAVGKRANELNHPVVLDPVGAGASPMRNETALRLLNEIRFDAIRGNMSEIKFLALGDKNTKGVDADLSDMITEDNIEQAVSFAKAFSKKTGAVIVITGATDIIAKEDTAYICENGTPHMSRITGTGCMLTCAVAAYICANRDNPLEAAASAVAAMGLCGQLAYQKIIEKDEGTGSLRTYIIDYMSKMSDEMLKAGEKLESR